MLELSFEDRMLPAGRQQSGLKVAQLTQEVPDFLLSRGVPVRPRIFISTTHLVELIRAQFANFVGHNIPLFPRRGHPLSIWLEGYMTGGYRHCDRRHSSRFGTSAARAAGAGRRRHRRDFEGNIRPAAASKFDARNRGPRT
jgi:hypothetical protein